MLPDDKTAQIEAWLDGLLDTEASAAFDAQLRSDPALAHEVRLHRAMRAAAREKDVGAFRQTVDTLLAELQPAAKAPKGRVFALPRSVWAIAATLLLGLAAVWFFRPDRPDAAQLYAEAFQPPDAFRYEEIRANTERDTAAAVLPVDWLKLNEAWAGKNTGEALRTALNIAQTDTVLAIRQSAWFAAGVVALSEQKEEAALEYLEKAGAVYPYAEDILWYKALATVQLALQDPARRGQALKMLRAVSDSPQPEWRHRLAEKMMEAL